MTNYQKYLIQKSTELEEIANSLQARIKAVYDRSGRIAAQDVAIVTELHNRAMGLVEAAGRVVE